MKEPEIKLNGKSWKPIFTCRDDMAVRDLRRDGHVCVLQGSVAHRLVACDAVRVFCADDNMKHMFDIIACNDVCCLLARAAERVEPGVSESSDAPVDISMTSDPMIRTVRGSLLSPTDISFADDATRRAGDIIGMDRKEVYFVTVECSHNLESALHKRGACYVSVAGKTRIAARYSKHLVCRIQGELVDSCSSEGDYITCQVFAEGTTFVLLKEVAFSDSVDAKLASSNEEPASDDDIVPINKTYQN